jgi:hypothetical protein
MAKRKRWTTTAPRIIYDAYPDQDLLPIEPPKPDETIGAFKLRAEDAGDTLFLFLCREADDEIDASEYVARLNQASRDIEAVRAAFRNAARLGKSKGAAPFLPPATIKLTLGGDWIKLTLDRTDSEGRRFGVVASSMHESSPDDDLFNAAMDAIESLVLGHACAGIDVTNPRYLEGVRTCLEACANHL